MNITFDKNTFSKRIRSMLSVDFRRLFVSPLFYIMVGICLVIPILVLVMTTMMDGSISVNPQTGEETVMEAFDSVWQIIGSVSEGQSAQSQSMDMSITSMCNINLIYFIIAVFVSIFVSDDFRSGYSKNLFTVRAKKTDYIISKTIVTFFAGALMIIAFFAGSLAGGAFAGLPFEMTGFSTGNLVMCVLAKVLIVPIFVSIYICMSVIGKHKLWLSILLSLCTGMLLFNIAPMVSPLNSTIMQPVLCFAGSVLFGICLGFVSKLILDKKDII